MISAAMLNRLLARAVEDLRHEPAFFRALLDAKVFAHVPISDPVSRRFRFIQFNDTETGQLLLPFFSDEARARAATGPTVRTITLRGRVFLDATRGAALMLNPNEERCILYPEEIETFLRTGCMARFEKFTVTTGNEPLIGPPLAPPAWLIDTLTTTLAGLSFVEVAYIASLHTPNGKGAGSTLLALGTVTGLGARAVHAVIAATQPACEAHQFALDIVHFVEPEKRPTWVEAFGLTPIYDKAWGGGATVVQPDIAAAIEGDDINGGAKRAARTTRGRLARNYRPVGAAPWPASNHLPCDLPSRGELSPSIAITPASWRASTRAAWGALHVM